jgi:arylsulfatase A-like enzyme
MNVLLVIIDCLRADRLASAERLAPNLHRLAEGSFRFPQAFTSGPYTKAAMPGLLYSAYYSAFLARRGRPGFRSLVQAMREGGYATMAVQTNAFMSSDFGWGRGFDYYDESILPWLRLTPRAILERQISARRGQERLRGVAERSLLYLLYCKGAADCRTVNRKFRALLRRAFRPRQRHFALLHYMDLHEPVVLPRAWRKGLPPLHPHRLSERAHSDPGALSAQEWGFLAGSYDAALGLVDAELGKLLDEPQVRAFLEEAVLIITSDHGEELGEHGCFGHATRFYDQLLRVPLIIRLPGQSRGRALEAMVCHLDLGPTLLEACGLPPQSGFAGQSLVGLLEGRSSLEDRALVAEALVGGRQWTYCVRTRRHKLIEAARELYDLEADPAETLNLYGSEPGLVSRLGEVIAAHRDQAAGQEAAVEDELANGRLRDRLRGLGYVD